MLRILILVATLFSLPVSAQDLPDWKTTSISDYAEMISNDDARIIDQALIALHDETGVQGTVVTLIDRARYGGSDGLEPFTTRLFNHWGVGAAERNDGFMLLLLRDDREVRVELGDGYSRQAGAAAQAIIDDTVLSDFRAGEMSKGIRDGTLAIIDGIARPHAAGLGFDGPAQQRDPIGWLLPIGVFGMFGFVGFQILRKIWQRIKLGRQPCPNCGGSGLIQESEIIQPTDGKGRASQVMWTRCPRCNWRSPRSDPMPVSRHRGLGGRSGGFGGGRSSGGGASGRW